MMVAAARRHRPAGRDAADAEAGERGGVAGARAARSALQAARAADDAGAGRRPRSTSAAACTSCCRSRRRIVECGVARRSGRRRALGPHPRRGGAARRSIRPAARLLAQRAGTDVKRLRADVDRLLLYALGQKQITVDDVRRGGRTGGAAGRLGDDQRDRSGAGRRRAAPARADARRRRAGREDSRTARLAGAGEVSRDRAAAACGRRSTRCSGPTWI